MAVEGECPGLRLSVVGHEVFAHTESGAIARLTGGAPTLLPAFPDDSMPPEELVGRWPDQLYATYVTPEGFSLADGLMHLDGSRWVRVAGFGNNEPIRAVVPLTDELAVVHVLADEGPHLQDQLRLVGGDAAAPDLTPLARSRSCAPGWGISHPTMDRQGNLGVSWECGSDEHFAIWRAGEATPQSHQLPIPPDYGPFRVVSDARGGFFVAFRSGRMAHVDQQGSEIVAPPPRSYLIEHLSADSDGRLWLVTLDRLYRQVDDGWARQRVPGRARIHEFAGIEHGPLWIRRGGTFYVHGFQYRENGLILARDHEGRWHRVAPVPSAFDPKLRLYVDFLHADDAGGMWMLAHGRPGARRSREHPTYYAIVTTTEVTRTLRCPDDLEG